MDKIIVSLTDAELTDLITNIESEKLCLLMLVLGEEGQNRILSTMSETAQKFFLDDVKKLEEKIK